MTLVSRGRGDGVRWGRALESGLTSRRPRGSRIFDLGFFSRVPWTRSIGRDPPVSEPSSYLAGSPLKSAHGNLVTARRRVSTAQKADGRHRRRNTRGTSAAGGRLLDRAPPLALRPASERLAQRQSDANASNVRDDAARRDAHARSALLIAALRRCPNSLLPPRHTAARKDGLLGRQEGQGARRQEE